MSNIGRRKKIFGAATLLFVIAVAILSLAACTLADPNTATTYLIVNNEENAPNINTTTRDQAISNVTNGLDSLREYLNKPEIANTGYYMGVDFNINTEDTRTHVLTNFRLKIQAHLFTYRYEDDDGNLIYKYLDKRDGKYYDAQNPEGTRERVSAQDIHNEVIKKSDLLIEWYDGISNQMLIGLYYDGLNGNSEDPGNIMYLNIQGYKRSFLDWGDTVLYQQLIRLLMSLSIEKLMVAANIQGDSGTSSIRSVFELLVTDNYKTVLNGNETSTLFYSMNATPIADTLTDFIQGIFRAFRNDQTNEYPLDPFTNKYLGFKFSVMGAAVLNAIATDMQFFTEPDPTDGTSEILTGAHLTFNGAATSLRNNYSYDSDATFEYGAYPPEDIKLDRGSDYVVYQYGKYEFTGNLYVPLINSNFDALIRTDMQQYYNYRNNIFMEYRDIANGELMIGAYYRGDIAESPDVDRINQKGELVHDKQGRSFIDITGMEYLYGWIDLNQLGFPKVYDEHINMADQLDSYHRGVNDAIVSIVDSILSPDKNDKENMLLTYIMRKMSKTEKVDGDIFSRNTETLLVDMELIKQFLRETGTGDYTTRQVINILDSMMPYTMDQIAIMLGVANAEVMLDNTFFTFRLDVDSNEIRICMYTNVNRTEDEGPMLIFQLDLVPVIVGEDVNIADLRFENFKPLEQIYTYSATMNGNFIFSTAETVDLSKLLSATIGENSGLNTPYTLAQNAGITFRLVYDQFVTDHEVEGVMRYQGRSAFELNVWLTGAESSVIIRIATDDVAFSNDVYGDQPARANELGYVWVSIECVTDYGVQRVPKVKIREDVFMSSMQAYMNGTKISDDAADLGNSEVNLSITSILFALIEDSYVVMEPEQIEITSSNETLQNLFRVKGLIGNIRADAGFTHRVSGLQSIRDDYGLYQVGQFENVTGNSPYDTELHHTVPVYFYEDYIHYHYIKPNRDTFDSFTPNKTSEGLDGYNLGGRPKGYTWGKATGASGDGERNRLYGVYNAVTDSDEKLATLYTDADGNPVFNYLPEDFDIRAFLTIDGENSLVLSNKTTYGQHYVKTDPVVIESATYYKMTFRAKTLLPQGSIAEFRFFLNGADGAYQSIQVGGDGTSPYTPVDYTIYIDNPTKDFFRATWGFYLGDAASGLNVVSTHPTTGMMVVDKILFCSVDEAEYLAAQEAFDALGREEKPTARTRVYAYPVATGATAAERAISYDPLAYDLRVDRERGTIQVYEKGGRVSVYREEIEYANDSFFLTEDANNQDISRVRFRLEKLPFVYRTGDRYAYLDYNGEEVRINENYIRTEGSQVYVYFLGVTGRVHHLSGAEYCYYDGERALVDENGDGVYFYTQVYRDFLFEYDAQSIEITEQAKTQYAPRINGSFMGEIRRYILVLTSPLAVERGKLIELYDRTFYNEEDRDHSIQLYDEDGVALGDPVPDPIVLFVMEPCEPLAKEVAVNIQVGNNVENYVLPASFAIDWDAVTLKGEMLVTEVVVAPGMMGEQSFPVRIIVTNREISPLNDDTVSVYVEDTDHLSEMVPVVDYIEIDPYDYIIAKNDFFMNIANYNPDQYAATGDDPEYLRKYREKEVEFVKRYFSTYPFSISFRGDDSILYAKIGEDDKREKYVAYSYKNAEGNVFTPYEWAFDAYSEGNYTEDKIKAVADGGATHTALYLHTYFKGQLIALQVNVMTRRLSHVKFYEDDDFDPVAANPGKEPGDQGYIYGHYVANYFDEDSYEIPVNPIFVFTDGAGHYYEKVFDMAYISGLATNGSYIVSDRYGLAWGNPLISYIGANGSYYYEEVWCSDDLTETSVSDGKLYVESCDDNVFLSDRYDRHGDATIDSAQRENANAVGAAFDAYFTNTNWANYGALFTAVGAFYDAANSDVAKGKLYGQDVFDVTDINNTAMINVTSGSVLFDGSTAQYDADTWVTILARLFGLSGKDAFRSAAQNYADAFLAATPETALSMDGAIYTSSNNLVLPYAVRYVRGDNLRVVVVTAFLSSTGSVCVLVNGANVVEEVVNLSDVSYAIPPQLTLYGRCQIAEFGKVLVNRPFDVSQVVRDENGNILYEGEPIQLYPSDVTSSSINWFDLFTVYKPDRAAGTYLGTATELHLIAGDETYSGFMTTVVRITVECPKLEIANVTSDGVEVLEADDLDFDTSGNKVLFTPTSVDFSTGTNPGYYFIDPLDASTLAIPSSIIIGFVDKTNSRMSTHLFTNIAWRASFDKVDGQYVGDGRLVNDSGVQVLRYDASTDRYYFDLPTDEPTYTKIMAKIGSDLSGYQYVTVCVRVLSKDPQEVEFFYGVKESGSRVNGIERTDVDFTFSDADKATEFAFYTYYVDTFADFRMPTYVKAYFGVSKERVAYYDVTWRAANGRATYFRPDSICNMVAEIGTGEVVIYIYLSVVVANHSIERVELTGGLEGYFVKVGTDDNYVRIEDLLHYSFGLNPQIGLYMTDGVIDQYILINAADDVEQGLEAGKIPLYASVSGRYELRRQLFPYEFIKQAYSSMNLYFNNGNSVDLPDVGSFMAEFHNASLGQTLRRTLAEAAEVTYAYDASSDQDTLEVTFRYQSGGRYYYPQPNESGIVYVSTDGGNTYDVPYTLYELAILYTYKELSVRYDEKVVAVVSTSAGDIDLTGQNVTVRNLSGYTADGVEFTYDGGVLDFLSMSFEDGTSASFNELAYRLSYLYRHRVDDYPVGAVRNKAVAINDFEGIFYVNDVVRPAGRTFVPSDKYVVSLGTGENAYDVKLNLVFDGGYRMTEDSEATEEIRIRPYTTGGFAQYGARGYVFGDALAIGVDAVAQDGRGVEELFAYGPDDLTKDRLDRWYVEASSFGQLAVGSFIEYVPQSIIYSSRNGSVTVSTLTKEGFRIRRVLTFDGVPSEINDFSSSNRTGLVINGGVITIEDVYDYLPLTTYFAGTEFLPKTISTTLGTSTVNVNNVEWTILESWYGATTEDSLGRRVGAGELDHMTYTGTYNVSSGVVSEVAMATAEILGWADANGEYHDRITITVKIAINSTEIVGLPWDIRPLSLYTMTLKDEEDVYRFDVEVDAFNDAGSSAISGENFILPSDIEVSYLNGDVHLFRSVSYRYNDLVLTSIPYDITGIDTATLAAEFGVGESYFPYKDHIDLKVNVGLNQILNIRFLFYDKTVGSIVPILEPNDETIREQIRAELTAKATDKSTELLDKFNATRIKTNVENMYDRARAIRELLTMPTAEDLLTIPRSSLTVEYVKGILYDESAYVVLHDDGATEEVSSVKTTPYELTADWNYALDKIRESAKSAAERYAQVLYDVLAPDVSLSQKRTNVIRQVENFVAAVFNDGYDAMIGDYVKMEMRKVFEEEAYGNTTAFVTTAVKFKNVTEGAFDYDEFIRRLVHMRKLVRESYADKEAMESEFGTEENYFKEQAYYLSRVFIESAIDVGIRTCPEVTQDTIDLVRGVLYVKLGLTEDYSGMYENDADCRSFVASVYNMDRKNMYVATRAWVKKLFDFSIGSYTPSQITEVNDLVKRLVDDNIESIQNYSVTVGAIRRNLNTSVDISSMLNTILSRGVKNFVDNVYMESLIVTAVKRAQGINLLTDADYGYYYIDPYYDFRVMPTKVRATFDEENGGFDYTFTATWASDPISGRVNYAGNKKLDWFGYFHAFYNAMERYPDSPLLTDLILRDAIEPTIEGKTWAKIREENTTINDVMESIESYATTFFGAIQESEREGKYIFLYTYFRAGQELLAYADQVISETYAMDADRIRRDYDKYRYDDLVASLVNANTKETQEVSLVTEVADRTLDQGQLIVRDGDKNPVRSFTVDNPFEVSLKDIPNLIQVGDEYLEIVWSNVQIGPAGNYSSVASGNNYLVGYVANSGGQEIRLPLFVDRWEYAGVYEWIDGEYVLMNTGRDHVMDFYFNEYLTYSAQEKYQVRFKVYRIEKNDRDRYVESDPTYRSVIFYPEDSALLVNSVNDDEMRNVRARKNYVLYWDEMAIAQVIGNKSSSTIGSVFLGNDSIGKHNLTTLSTNSTNDGLARSGDYHYEGMRVESLALDTLAGEWLYSVDGTATYATDVTDTLPETGKVKLFTHNVDYDESAIEVRILWNKSYSAAINALVNFIEYAFTDVESAARTQYARALLLDEYDVLSTRSGDVYEAAKEYVKMRDPSLDEKGVEREADQLLMVNERYDFVSSFDRMRGGSYANETVDILIRYADSANLYVQEGFRVRLVFADCSPMAYYQKDGENYRRVDNAEDVSDLTDLYIGVRKKYWYDAQTSDAYTVEGKNTPYDNIGNDSFKLLEEKYDVDYGVDEADELRLIHLTDVVYADGSYRSESFVIDGVRYRSDLVSLR